MISKIFKAIGLIDAGASAQQFSFMEGIQAISTECAGDIDEYTACVNGNVNLTFSRKLPTFGRVEGAEIALTDIQSLYEGKGNVRQALEDVKKLVVKNKVDLAIEVQKLVYRSEEDYNRLGIILLKSGFVQDYGNYELFFLRHSLLVKKAGPELKPV